MDTEEQWLESSIPYHDVSSLGRVRSRLRPTPVIRKQDTNSRHGYKILRARVGGRLVYPRVHRLVCRAFHGEPPSPKHVAAHLNGDKADNRSGNLAWVTQAENCSHKVAHGTSQRGARHPTTRLSDLDVLRIRGAATELGYPSRGAASRIARDAGVSLNTVYGILRRVTWKHI
jgi:hypothetical protein